MAEPRIIEAVKLLEHYSRGSFQVWSLAGPAFKRVRAQIMSAIAGEKVPIAKAGVTAIEKALYEIAKIGERGYAGEEALALWCGELLAAAEREHEASIAYQGPG